MLGVTDWRGLHLACGWRTPIVIVLLTLLAENNLLYLSGCPNGVYLRCPCAIFRADWMLLTSVQWVAVPSVLPHVLARSGTKDARLWWVRSCLALTCQCAVRSVFHFEFTNPFPGPTIVRWRHWHTISDHSERETVNCEGWRWRDQFLMNMMGTLRMTITGTVYVVYNYDVSCAA